jgi:hypothetical protein
VERFDMYQKATRHTKSQRENGFPSQCVNASDSLSLK